LLSSSFLFQSLWANPRHLKNRNLALWILGISYAIWFLSVSITLTWFTSKLAIHLYINKVNNPRWIFTSSIFMVKPHNIYFAYYFSFQDCTGISEIQ
jgi:hypothetical protein